jgi:hypothetical protein
MGNVQKAIIVLIYHRQKRLDFIYIMKNKLRGFSPQGNYTDRATAVCRRS